MDGYKAHESFHFRYLQRNSIIFIYLHIFLHLKSQLSSRDQFKQQFYEKCLTIPHLEDNHRNSLPVEDPQEQEAVQMEDFFVGIINNQVTLPICGLT
jgi:hypothetical protein